MIVVNIVVNIQFGVYQIVYFIFSVVKRFCYIFLSLLIGVHYMMCFRMDKRQFIRSCKMIKIIHLYHWYIISQIKENRTSANGNVTNTLQDQTILRTKSHLECIFHTSKTCGSHHLRIAIIFLFIIILWRHCLIR
jgi:hypothetical protein